MPDLAVSAPFILSERYIKVDAPADSEFAGFWCEVRQNLSNGDRRLLIEQLDAISDSAAEQIETSRLEAERIAELLKGTLKPVEHRAHLRRMGEMTDEMEALAEAARLKRLALVAPHIRDWNAATYEGDDVQASVKVPPPQTGGAASLDAVSLGMSDWITQELLQAYRSGKGVLNRSKPPGDSGQPTGGPKAASRKGAQHVNYPHPPEELLWALSVSVSGMRPWEFDAMSAYDYHFLTDIVAAFKDAIASERRAEQKAASMKGQG